MSVNNRSPIAKPAEPKPRKLRASCDACSRAKVKCDKVRPTCHRCGNMGICCNYSPSMRLGKPRKNRSIDMSLIRDVSPASSCGAFGSRLDMRSRTASSTAESSPEPIDSFFFGPNTPEYPYQDAFMAGFNSRYSPETTTGPSLPGYHTEDLFLTPSSEPLFSSPLSHFPPSYHTGTLSVPITMPGHSAQFTTPQTMHHPMSSQAPNHYSSSDDQSYFTSKYMTEPTAMTGPCPLPTPDPAPTSTPHARDHDCTEFAFSTLSNLYAPPSYQPSAADFGAAAGLPTLDSVLATNKDAVEKVSVLLGCPCSTNPHYSTTVAFTIIKILAWYQAVAGLGSPHNAVSASSAAADGTASSGGPLEAFTATPIALGAFQLDGEDEARFRAQVVLGELRRVEKLVDKFSDRYCKAAAGAREKMEQGGGAAGGVYGSLETLLRTRVRETVAMTLGGAAEDVRRQWQQAQVMGRRRGEGWGVEV
ncbi:hypothetical protein BU16DRAFT_560850 [Lophium mytilinum]|uniref:Zn(2)-C6 fungal-type domain-containing protein n=1 Tax=Lophium mytilinum TaxID=390894 RepID=A0A6A6QV07_9PEZI|nr:hypothetical protein BU16DRAFT_560850 [Lophium mytilinum]